MLISLTLLSSLAAQTVGGDFSEIRQWSAYSQSPVLRGIQVANAGDLNGDGIPDQLVFAPNEDVGGILQAGSVSAYSGAGGTLLHRWDGNSQGEGFGWSADGAGDVDQDGYDDVLIGSVGYDGLVGPGSGAVFLYSGNTGALIRRIDGPSASAYLGASVRNAGDFNGDGIPDQLAGSWTDSLPPLIQSGSVSLFSGADGTLIRKFYGSSSDQAFGDRVDVVGDLTGDGTPELVVGGEGDQVMFPLNPGTVSVVDGLTGSVLFHEAGDQDGGHLGWEVLGTGDVDGDGVPDFAASRPHPWFSGNPDNGEVWVYSGSTGSLLHHWIGSQIGEQLGWSLDAAGDINGDGHADLLVGSRCSTSIPDFACIYSGADGAALQRWDDPQQVHQFGTSVANAGDLDGDGKTEIMILGSVAAGGAIVSLFDYEPYLQASTRQVSAAAGGIVDLDLDFPAAAAGQEYLTLMSISGAGPIQYGVSIPLAVDSYLLDATTGIYPFPTTGMHGTLDPIGDGTASITFAPGAFQFAVGHTFWLAAVCRPTGQLPAYSSVAIPITFLP